MTGCVSQWRLGNVSDGSGIPRLGSIVGSAICRPYSESNRTPIPDRLRTFDVRYTRKTGNLSSRRSLMLNETGNRTQRNFVSFARTERCAGSLPERSEEHTSELQSLTNLVCRLLLEKKK